MTFFQITTKETLKRALKNIIQGIQGIVFY